MRGEPFGKKAYTIFRQNRVYSSCRRLCSRTGKYMEIPLFGSRIRRRHLFIFLYIWYTLIITFTELRESNECYSTFLGRKTGRGVVGTFQSLDKRFTFMGWLTMLVPILTLPYYSVTGGWVMHYGMLFLTGQGAKTAETGFFQSFSANPLWPVFWLCIFLKRKFFYSNYYNIHKYSPTN